MIEKRRAKRIPVKLRLEISKLFKQDHILVEDLNAPIEVVNISKMGVGFITESTLPLGFYFNAIINWKGEEDSILYCVVKIIREDILEDGRKRYGGEFIGFPPVFDYIFEEYEKNFT